MNKINLLKKAFLGVVAIFGIVTLGSCASANRSDARILSDKSTCTILTDEKSNKRVDVTLAIDNQTIFSINKIEVVYDYEIEGKKADPISFEVDCYIRYGVSGYAFSSIPLEGKEYEGITSIKINANSKVIGFQSLWDSYMGWFIAAIIIFALSFGGFLFAIFSQHINRSNIKEFLNHHISTTLITAFFALIICIIPLIFSSWVVSLILFGSFLANILLSLLVTMLRANHLEKKKID